MLYATILSTTFIKGEFMGNISIIYVIGQIIGVCGIILGVISYQIKSQTKLLLVQTITTVVFIVHYLIIGAVSGMALNIVNLAKNTFYWYKSDKGGAGKVMPAIFAVIMCGLGVYSAIIAQTWYSVFLIVGLTLHVIGFALPTAEQVRASILVTSPLVMIYNIFAKSIGGTVYEAVATVSAAIGVIRFKKQTKVKNEE